MKLVRYNPKAMEFHLKSPYKPTGDQPHAIESLTRGLQRGDKLQVLLGVTGSGKTFTAANVIANLGKPALVISHNKTLAAQLYQEFRDFFPENAVSYFVSYYDYYQPEAYIPQTDTFIDKETEINEEIDRLRLATTTNLLTRKDVIVVASVSCIYNLGSPIEYGRFILEIKVGETRPQKEILSRLVELQYERSDYELQRGTFRVRGDSAEVWPAYEDKALRIQWLMDTVQSITSFDPLTRAKPKSKADSNPGKVIIYPSKHYITDPASYKEVFLEIQKDLRQRVKQLNQEDRQLEAHRLKQRVQADLEMVKEFGYVNGIENYSRYFDGRRPGEPPQTLLDHFLHCDPDFLVMIDESHITIPQIRGMHEGDKSRKQTLVDYGFRLPSAIDNRPLNFTEFLSRTPRIICTSATPNDWERRAATQTVEQLIRPTGLIDPEIEIRPTENQIDDLLKEIRQRVNRGERTLVTTLTKRTAEALSEYLETRQIRIHYLHSDITTLKRSDILDNLRQGTYDVVVGINLLREGLDLPEVSLVAILDADKEGFLRSETSLIQTMGRAARHLDGRVIMYADSVTGSMQRAIEEVRRRRGVQLEFNKKHGITPKSIQKPIREKLIREASAKQGEGYQIQLSKWHSVSLDNIEVDSLTPQNKNQLKDKLTKAMHAEARHLNFELAAKLRDAIAKLTSE